MFPFPSNRNHLQSTSGPCAVYIFMTEDILQWKFDKLYKITTGNWKQLHYVRLIKIQIQRQDNGESKFREPYNISHHFGKSVFSHLAPSNNNKSNIRKADP